MSRLGQYTDSASADNPQQSTWRSIGEIIACEVAPEVARRVHAKQAEGGK